MLCWLQVERVLAERRGPSRSGSGDTVQYLVAWRQLPLEQASWEDAAVRAGGYTDSGEPGGLIPVAAPEQRGGMHSSSNSNSSSCIHEQQPQGRAGDGWRGLHARGSIRTA